VPEQPDHVLYVWVDALSNYITALGFADEGPDYKKWWVNADVRQHLIGKDIIRFHCLYWPAILYAAGVPVPTREFAQGFITKDGVRLSKTTGNIIDPVALVERLGPDPARYFLLREASYGSDWDFTDKAFVTRYNADLANDLGNLVSRALTMVARYSDAKVPPRPSSGAKAAADFTQTFAASVAAPANGLADKVLERYEELDFSGALGEIWSWIGQFNQAIVQTEPWTLAKDPARKGELDAFLYRLIEGVRLVATLASPVIPRASARIFAMLGLGEREPIASDLAWGRLEPGTKLGEIAPLFPRVDKSPEGKETPVSDNTPKKPEPAPAGAAAPTAALAPAATPGDKIDIGDFAKVELRAARITSAEKVAGSKKLVKLQVDMGGEARQVVAGIAESYDPDALVGKTIVLVANLKPAKLMGVESNGMVLAGSEDGRAVLCTFDSSVAPGTKVK
jgi:methionyl-tRNA synthetase